MTANQLLMWLGGVILTLLVVVILWKVVSRWGSRYIMCIRRGRE